MVADFHLVRFDHEERAGHEGTPDDPDYVRETGHPAYRADDALWLVPDSLQICIRDRKS